MWVELRVLAAPRHHIYQVQAGVVKGQVFEPRAGLDLHYDSALPVTLFMPIGTLLNLIAPDRGAKCCLNIYTHYI